MKYKRGLIAEFFVVCLLFGVIVFLVTGGLGTLTSGWHFVDDHELLRYSSAIKYGDEELIDIISKAVKTDSQARNRFLYHPFRILAVRLWGADSFALSVVRATETAIAMVLLYYCGKLLLLSGEENALQSSTDEKKHLKQSVVAFFFSLVCMVGFQGATWWKLGPQQIQATICFSISFLFLLRWDKNKDKIFYGIMSFLFLIIMGMFHESYVFVMPFFALWPVYVNLRHLREEGIGVAKEVDSGKKVEWRKLKGKLFDKRSWYIIAVTLLCFGTVMMMIIRLGFHNYSLVRVDSGISLRSYFDTLASSLTRDLKWYWYLGILLVGIYLTYYDEMKRYWADWAMAAIFILPQFVLYFKEGIAERYILPAVIGYAMLFVLFAYNSRILTGGRKKVYIGILIIMLLMNGRSMIIEADYYRFRGESVTKALEEIESLRDRGYQVMTCFGISNPEADATVEMYLKSHGKEEAYYWDEEAKAVTVTRPYLKQNTFVDMNYEEMDVIMAYNRNDRHFRIDPSLELDGYTCVRIGSIDAFFRNDVYEEIDRAEIESFRIKPTIYGIGTE